ncbi:MAG TPA: hypothetical protein PLG90_03085 [Ignavibacteria bacterium]|nr:hypothetical protein [Ignavibacteria bacterium]
MSKAIEILDKLNKTEIFRFEKFINSEYFEIQNYVRKFYFEFKKFLSIKKLTQNDKIEIYKKLYPTAKYNDITFRKLTSELLKLLKLFLAIQEFGNDKYGKKINYIRQLKKLNLNDLALREIKKLEYELSNDIYSIKNLHSDYSLALEEMITPIKSSQFDELKFINKVENKLLSYSISEFLDFYSHLLHQSKYIHKKTHRYLFLEYIMDFLKKNIDQVNEYSILYYKKILLYLEPENISNYKELKTLFYKNLHKLNRTSVNNMFAVLHSYINDRILSGDKKYLKDKSELFAKVFFENNSPEKINFVILFIAVETYLQLRDFEKAKNLIDKWGLLLPESLQTDTVKLCNAALFFYNNKFGESLEALSKIKNNDYFFNMKIKDFRLMIFIENKDYENAIYLINTYRTFLTKESALSDLYKLPPLNFCKGCLYLISLEAKFNANIEFKFIKLLNNNKLIAYKWWLENKFNKLKKYDTKNNKSYSKQ